MPAPAFLRVRELVDGRPGKIFKQGGHTLRYVAHSTNVSLGRNVAYYNNTVVRTLFSSKSFMNF